MKGYRILSHRSFSFQLDAVRQRKNRRKTALSSFLLINVGFQLRTSGSTCRPFVPLSSDFVLSRLIMCHHIPTVCRPVSHEDSGGVSRHGEQEDRWRVLVLFPLSPISVCSKQRDNFLKICPYFSGKVLAFIVLLAVGGRIDDFQANAAVSPCLRTSVSGL